MNQVQREQIRSYIQENREEMLKDIISLVSIPSERGEPLPGMPYGEGPYQALQQAETLLQSAGLTVRDWDHRVVTGDLTDLPEGLDILAHVDVVPCDKNWTVCKPYEPVLKDGKLYGRGTMDDKGPAVAALYAMKCVRDLGFPLKKNVRLILGSDEECGSSDVEYYYARNPEAPMTFSPDANFPLINLEKGRYSTEILGTFPETCNGAYLKRITCGIKSNVVPNEAVALLSGISLEEVGSCIQTARQETKADFKITAVPEGIEILCQGTSAHAAMPEEGNNALTALLALLVKLPLEDSEAFSCLCKLQALFPHGDYAGKALGIAMKDECSGPLTCSPDLLTWNPDGFSLTFDARCPVCSNEENTKQVLIAAVEKAGFTVREEKMVQPHYVNPDSEFVQTLLRVYTECTGLPGEAQSTGGGTYVHELKNGVAFGCETEGIDNCIHGANEYITLDQLWLSTEIFACAILELCG